MPTASRSSAPAVRGPDSLTTWSSDSPWMNSLTMYGSPSLTPASSTRAVQNSATFLAASASRRSPSSASPPSRARSSLTATCSPDGAVAR
ncbi:hypothetical protein [Nonomuraea terrae]|uniref:hypothetical protein n=1 Tax=Nonomuraea terrae TaxID=2530383 RepID=UPI001CB718BF|nr:hypothetical protein [Nonomuraea terrae]